MGVYFKMKNKKQMLFSLTGLAIHVGIHGHVCT